MNRKLRGINSGAKLGSKHSAGVNGDGTSEEGSKTRRIRCSLGLHGRAHTSFSGASGGAGLAAPAQKDRQFVALLVDAGTQLANWESPERGSIASGLLRSGAGGKRTRSGHAVAVVCNADGRQDLRHAARGGVGDTSVAIVISHRGTREAVDSGAQHGAETVNRLDRCEMGVVAGARRGEVLARIRATHTRRA